MDRAEWLKQKRHIAEERYDRRWAPIYDEKWGVQIDPVHLDFVTRLVRACPEDGSILDAACGTGKYWPVLLASGRKFTGIDQSQAMLERATAKYPQIRVKKLGLQELHYQDAYDLILCIDAMENVFPEDWPKVLENFHRALKPGGQLYFTVEIADPTTLAQDYQASLDKGFPVVLGESIGYSDPSDEQGGYHYYPTMDQVRTWIGEAQFTLKEEAESGEYHHFWVQKNEN